MKKLLFLALLCGSVAHARAGTFSTTKLQFWGQPTISAGSSLTLDEPNNQALYSCHAVVPNNNGTTLDYSNVLGYVEWRFRWEGAIGEASPGDSDGKINGILAGFGQNYCSARTTRTAPSSDVFSAKTTLVNGPWALDYREAGDPPVGSTIWDRNGLPGGSKLGNVEVLGKIGDPGVSNGKQVRYGYFRWQVNANCLADVTVNPNAAQGGGNFSDASIIMKVRLIAIANQQVAPDF